MRKLVRLQQVLEQTGLSRAGLYRSMSCGDFPPPVKIGRRAVAWPADEVEGWIASRIDGRRWPRGEEA